MGEALVKNIAPGKYGVQVVPPYGRGWQQTSTIEGTKGLDAWVKAGEPRYFAEFGPAGHHAEFGFVRPDQFRDTAMAAAPDRGHVTNLHMSRPPELHVLVRDIRCRAAGSASTTAPATQGLVRYALQR